ncbi:hypothetical protein IAT40_004966 [Kwoniella sp. CBS 6097]
MTPRPSTSRSHSANSALSSKTKGLPALPTGGLGLDFSGLSKEDEEFRLSINTTSKPSPTHFIPLRGSPFSANLPLTLPIRSPSIISSSPSTPTTGSTYPSPYSHPNHSASTVLNNSNPNQSTSTLTPMPTPASPSVSVTTPTPKKKITFGKSSMSADSMRSGDIPSRSPLSNPNSTSNASSSRADGGGLGRKRSSGQLLMGIGKGLNRVGSVMRRNTAEGNERTNPIPNPTRSGRGENSASAGAAGTTWKKGRRRKASQTPDDNWERVDRVEADEGDAGIGRPFNVGHDLHVSPDLGDLPPTWLESLREQGLTESDLLLISAARKRQHETHRVPLHHFPSLSLHNSDQGHGLPLDGDQDHGEVFGRAPKAPLSAPAPITAFLGIPSQPESPLSKLATPLVGSQSGAVDVRASTSVRSAMPIVTGSRPAGSKGLLLRKFSFDRSVRPAALRAKAKDRDVFDSKPIEAGPIASASASKTRSPPQRKKTDSFPVSASGHSDSLSHVTSPIDDTDPNRGVLIGRDSSEVIEIVTKDNEVSTARKNKRFSDQLKGFRESTFGLDEVDEDWGSSIISAAWKGSAPLSPSQGLSTSLAIISKPLKLESVSVKERDFAVSSLSSIPDRIPVPPMQENLVSKKPSTLFPEASTPPTRWPSSPPISPRSPPPPARPRKSVQSSTTPQASEPDTPMPAAPRGSSESFGVHYSSSKSSTSIGSEVITPCTSAEQGQGVKIREEDKLDADLDECTYQESDQSDHYDYLARIHPRQRQHHESIDGRGKKVEQDKSQEFELQNTTFGEIKRSALGDPIKLHDSIASLPHLPRRYHSNPRVSLPASAGQSSALPSRCVTPTDTMSTSASVSGRYTHERSESGNHPATEQLSPPHDSRIQDRGNASPCYKLKAQASYSTFDSTPFHPTSEGEDPLDGLDKAYTPDERASIALSILSSRTSTSMHSLHELSQATVRVAYKIPGRSTSDTSVPTMTSLRVIGGGTTETEESASSECSGFSVAGGYGSEETGEEARDAMDALGEAARKLRRM